MKKDYKLYVITKFIFVNEHSYIETLLLSNEIEV